MPCKYLKSCLPLYLVIKVGFCSSLWTQTKLAIGHMMRIVLETSHSYGQNQHTAYHCHGNKGDDCPIGFLRNLGYLRKPSSIRSLQKKKKTEEGGEEDKQSRLLCSKSAVSIYEVGNQI